MDEPENIVEFTAGWKAETVRCNCRHTWVAVYPVETIMLECPKCGNYTNIKIINVNFGGGDEHQRDME